MKHHKPSPECPQLKRRMDCVDQVVAWHLCSGCGTCVGVCETHAIQLVDVPSQGIRPQVIYDRCRECAKCAQVCPGLSLEMPPKPSGIIESLWRDWGPVLEVWHGYAQDKTLRFKASSGGVSTALASFCLEKGMAEQVAHTAADEDMPWRNKAVMSRCREELWARTGTRYTPAFPGVHCAAIDVDPRKTVFIGRPCDVAGLRKFQSMSEQLEHHVSLAISLCCAQTPCTERSLEWVKSLGCRPEQVDSLHYRGQGWPGKVTCVRKDRDEAYEMDFPTAWNEFLKKNAAVRCRLCPDTTGEFADITCGDQLYDDNEDNQLGRNLVMVRTERGRRILHEAVEAGYVRLEPITPEHLLDVPIAYLNSKHFLVGRLLAFKLMGLPIPDFSGLRLWTLWRSKSLMQQCNTLWGTWRRIRRYHWRRPSPSINQGFYPLVWNADRDLPKSQFAPSREGAIQGMSRK